MCRRKVLGKAGRGRGDRGRSLDSFEGGDAWERRGRVLLEIVVVMVVMVAANIGQSVGKGQGVRDARHTGDGDGGASWPSWRDHPPA